MPENKDPFKIWNHPMKSNNPFAPHNGPFGDNPFKPWNNPFGSEDDLTDSERSAYGLAPKYDDFEDDE